MDNSKIHRVAADTAGFILSPIVGIVCVPLAALVLAYHAVMSCYHNHKAGDQRKDYANYEAENHLSKKDVSWLNHERENVTHLKDYIETKEKIKTLAKGIIPILGYMWILRSDSIPKEAIEKMGDLSSKASWCTWHIDLLEGRLSKDSLSYKLGRNL